MKILIISLFLSLSLFGSILDFKTISTHFKQIVKNKSGSEAIYKGTLKTKGTDKMLWSYQVPIMKNVYINKNNVIIDEPELEQAITSTLNDELNILKIINNSKKISQNTYENKLEDTKYTIIIENNILKSINYKDELDNKVMILFTNFQKDITLSDNVFQFTIPKHYDVIKK
ncbi:MAG: LolA-like outer membrane lipoprotein chaperone [Epsilonproteobacteria bacterium]|nr:LolA-like outer membrane lipoprotein chaperone [Campylobacterota bacterium]